MSDWPDLYSALSRAEDAQRSAEQTKIDFERWCLRAEIEAMAAIYLDAMERVEDIARKIGVHFALKYPATVPWLYQSRGLRFRVLNIACRGNEVAIYSTRAAGSVPYIHLAHVRFSACPAHSPAIVSLPGCRLSRAANEGYALVDTRSPSADRPPSSDSRPHGGDLLEPKALVFRAFQILVCALDRCVGVGPNA